MGLSADHNFAAIAELPDWLVEAADPPQPPPVFKPLPTLATRDLDSDYHKAGVAGALRRMDEATPGERNGVLFWCACVIHERIRNGEINSIFGSQALATLAHTAQGRGLSAKEIHTTMNSAQKRIWP